MFGTSAYASLLGLAGLVAPAALPRAPLPPVLAVDAAVLTGTVLRADGTPLAGATVRCVRPIDPVIGCATGWYFERRCSLERVTTDDRGRFRFEFPEGLGLHSIEVMPTADTGRAQLPWRGTNGDWGQGLAAGETADVEVRVPASTRLQGMVVDEEGAGVPGAKVLLWSAGRPRGADGGPIPADSFVVSDTDGNFVVPATGDCTVLQAAAEDRFAVDALLANIAAGHAAAGLKLTLHKVGSVEGVVVDPAGSALANVGVFALRGPGREEWLPTDVQGVRRSTALSLSTRTDAQGKFTFAALPRDMLTISAGLAPYLTWSCTLVPDGQSLRIAFDAGATLQGTVRGPGGEPLRGAIVETTANGGYRQLTDAQGAFRFTGVPPSLYAYVNVQAEGHVSRQLEGVVVVAGQDNTLDVRLERELRIAGCVIKADGQPLANAPVEIRDEALLPSQDLWSPMALAQLSSVLGSELRLRCANTYTDDVGRFRLERLRPGRYQLRVGDRPQLFDVVSGDESLVLQLARPEDWRRRLLGNVVDAQTGQAIDDFAVTGQYDVIGSQPPDPLRQDGNRFIFDLYWGHVRVTIAAPDHVYWFGDFEGEEGRDYERVILLQPARRVAVKVVDEKGKPVSKCEVSVSCRGEKTNFAVQGNLCRGFATVDRKGRVELERLPRETLTFSILRRTGPGTSKVVATRVVDLAAEAGTTELEFVVTTAD